MKQKAISATLWGTAILGFFIACGLLYNASCKSKTPSILGSIPIGSDLADLDKIRKHWDVDREANVMQWIPTKKPPSDPDDYGDGAIKKTEFGTFLYKDLGHYEPWPATAEERANFTGTITFFHWYGFGNGDSIWLTYINGRLRNKDYGHLPS